MNEDSISRMKKFEDLTNLIADILEETNLEVKVTTGIVNSIEYYNKNHLFGSLSPGHSSGMHLSFRMPIDNANLLVRSHSIETHLEELDQGFVYVPEELHEEHDLIKEFFLLAFGYCGE